MTKAKARKRAKAKAAARVAGKSGTAPEKGGKQGIKAHPGKFDPKTTGLKGASPNVNPTSTIRRGASRSR